MPPLATLQTLLAHAKSDYIAALDAGLCASAIRYANEIASLELDIAVKQRLNREDEQ